MQHIVLRTLRLILIDAYIFKLEIKFVTWLAQDRGDHFNLLQLTNLAGDLPVTVAVDVSSVDDVWCLFDLR